MYAHNLVPAPTPIRWVNYSNGINIIWDAIAGVTSYSILYEDSGGSQYTISPISSNTATIPCTLMGKCLYRRLLKAYQIQIPHFKQLIRLLPWGHLALRHW